MKIFFWIAVSVSVLELISKLVLLGTGVTTTRKRGYMAVDAAFLVAFLVLAALAWSGVLP